MQAALVLMIQNSIIFNHNIRSSKPSLMKKNDLLQKFYKAKKWNLIRYKKNWK